MFNQRFVIVCSLTVSLTGCAGLYESQAPAPVSGRTVRPAPAQGTARIPSAGIPKAPSPEPPPVVSTKPLESFNQEISPIEIVPEPSAVAPSAPEENVPEGSVQEPASPEASESPVFPGGADEQPAFPPPTEPRQENIPAAPRPKPPEEAFVMTPFEPIEPPVSSSPAVGALVVAANQNSQAGNAEVAASSIDRALKIEPRNPSLYYKLALIRLKQSKPQEAEDLAKKSALLAGKDAQLKKHSWLLIAHARELRKDFKGAKQARAKADSF